MAGLSAGERAAQQLLARKEELALRITDVMYREDPSLLARYDQRGRARCLEDMRYNLEHLAPALALDEPAMFSGYVRWLVELLAAHGVPASDVRRSLELTQATLADVLDNDEAAAVSAAIHAGLQSIPQEERG